MADGDYLHALSRAAVSDPGKYTEGSAPHQDRDSRPAMEPLPEWQARTVQAALANTGHSIIRSDAGRTPAIPQIRAWLTGHHWTLRATGTGGGTAWNAPSGTSRIGVPGDGHDDALTIKGVIARIAEREGRPADEVQREMAAIDARRRDNCG